MSRRGLLAVPVLAGLAWPSLARAAGGVGGSHGGPLGPGGDAAGGLPRVALAQAGLPPAVAARLPAAMREAIAQARQARLPVGAVLLDVGTG